MLLKLMAMSLWKILIKARLNPGDLLEVEITDADEYDLYAQLISIKSN